MMNKTILLIFLILGLIGNAFAQLPLFNKVTNINNFNGGSHLFSFIYETPDGGYLFNSPTTSLSFNKTNVNADSISYFDFSDPKYYYGDAQSNETSDGNLVVFFLRWDTAYANWDSINSDIDYKGLIVKTTFEPDTLSTFAFSLDSSVYGTYDIIETHDKGFACLTQHWNDSLGYGYFQLNRISKTGEMLWQKNFIGADNQTGSSLIQNKDMGFIISGNSYGYGQGNGEIYLVRTDSLGNMIWQKKYGGQNYSFGRDIIPLKDGNFVIAGFTSEDSISYRKAILIKVDENGSLIWDKTYPKTNHHSMFWKVSETEDSSLVMVGQADSTPGWNWDYSKAILMKVNSLGDLIWEREFDNQQFGGNRFYDFSQTSDNGFIVTGQYQTNVWLLKTDCFGCDGILCSYPDSLCSYEDTNVFVPEHSLNNEAFLGQNYPNPFDQTTTISYYLPENISKASIRIYDLIGNMAQEYLVSNKSNRLLITSSDLPSGIYVYSLMIGDEEKQFKKMLINR